MSPWIIVLLSFSSLAAIMGFLPLLPFSHWIFRVSDFLRLQLLALLAALLIAIIFIVPDKNTLTWIIIVLLIASMAYQVVVVLPYLFIFRKQVEDTNPEGGISLLSTNVLQKNNDYHRLVELINEKEPDMLLVIEADKAWEEGIAPAVKAFPHSLTIPLDNTYGMLFYTRLPALSLKKHFLVSDETPSIEAHLKDKNGKEFIFWGIHPPPPSPTEKATAKQKDAELMRVAELVKDYEIPCLVAGDFNNVCWSNSSKLFARVSGLLDARRQHGMHSTFPVRPKWMRFPIDLLFHAKEIGINELNTFRDIGSDHLPFFAHFTILSSEAHPEPEADAAEESEAQEKIAEGKEEAREEGNGNI